MTIAYTASASNARGVPRVTVENGPRLHAHRDAFCALIAQFRWNVQLLHYDRPAKLGEPNAGDSTGSDDARFACTPEIIARPTSTYEGLVGASLSIS